MIRVNPHGEVEPMFPFTAESRLSAVFDGSCVWKRVPDAVIAHPSHQVRDELRFENLDV